MRVPCNVLASRYSIISSLWQMFFIIFDYYLIKSLLLVTFTINKRNLLNRRFNVLTIKQTKRDADNLVKQENQLTGHVSKIHLIEKHQFT